ncbi:PREDICTED: uncharacterized protein LOC109361856 [Lupinus angustifolius]|uniref:uncharacterized protein LOC109361856 n=1 Tax=Lupinus angustifolius TaxID=3871 RepID=UPI00092F5540|nr:PREDICTED: uncharacterized protein LOC109361856 [Lupinus angustifolius]
MLTKLPSHTEIKAAVFVLNGDSAPGPDGFSSCFFHNLSLSVLMWAMLFCNFSTRFKIITKILADRLAIIAPKIISKQQRGFIKDKQIKDCICLASEAINMLDHKAFGSNLAIKLDIKKAFDTIDWTFLLDTLHAFGFNHKFIHWISTILDSSKLSIIVNGNSVGFFKCTRGVRQGDPLSPLLFCLAEDVLSRDILKLVNEKKISTIASPNRMHSPSHVLYADDILIFCKGVKIELLCLKKLVMDYAQVSGQQINTRKCRFYVINANARKINDISSLLGFVRGSLPFNYLGVPLFKGKPRRYHLQPISDRILAKLATWKGSSLSIMGRVELVRSIIHSMFLYSFHIYKWPASLIDCLDKGIRNFIWYGDIGTRKLVPVAWSKVCVPISQGGLGLRSIKMLNKATLLHLAWDMRCDNHDWARLCRNRFGNYKDPPNRHFKSSIWPGIKESWSITSSNSIWLIGNGENVNFLKENWLGEPIADTMGIPAQIQSSLLASVSDFIVNSKWIIPVPIKSLFPDVALGIANTIISNGVDKLVWRHSEDGLLSLKVAYDFVSNSSNPLNWNQIRFEDMVISVNQAIARIIRDTSISGNYSSVVANPSINDLIILKHFKVSIHYNSAPKSAPKITEVLWLAPSSGWIKANTDGAAFDCPGHAGGGGIFRDHKGVFLLGFGSYLNIQSTLYVELYSAIKAISLAYKKGWLNIWLEVDSVFVCANFQR